MIGNIVSDVSNTSSICKNVDLASEAGSNVWFYKGNTVCKSIFRVQNLFFYVMKYFGIKFLKKCLEIARFVRFRMCRYFQISSFLSNSVSARRSGQLKLGFFFEKKSPALI